MGSLGSGDIKMYYLWSSVCVCPCRYDRYEPVALLHTCPGSGYSSLTGMTAGFPACCPHVEMLFGLIGFVSVWIYRSGGFFFYVLCVVF